LAYWPALLPFLLLSGGPHTPSRPLRLVVWGLATATVSAAFLYGWSGPEHPVSLWMTVRRPVLLAAFCCAYLASPLAPVGQTSVATGAAGILAALFLGLRLWRRHRDTLHAWVPFVAVILYVLGSGAIIAHGRIISGVGTALASRYCTLTLPFWIALGAMALLGLKPRTRLALLPLGVALVAAAGLTGLWDANARYCILVPLQVQILAPSEGPVTVLPTLSDKSALIAQYGPALRERRLGHFRPELQRSAEDLSTALLARSRSAATHAKMGMACAATGRADLAARHLEQAVGLDSDHGQAWFNLALARLQLRETRAAATAFEQVLARTPEDACAHYGLGVALAQLGQLDSAREHLEAAVRLDPDNPEFRRALGR